MDSLQRLHDLSKKNHVPFEELCSYAIESANDDSGGGEQAPEENNDNDSPATDTPPAPSNEAAPEGPGSSEIPQDIVDQDNQESATG